MKRDFYVTFSGSVEVSVDIPECDNIEDYESDIKKAALLKAVSPNYELEEITHYELIKH